MDDALDVLEIDLSLKDLKKKVIDHTLCDLYQSKIKISLPSTKDINSNKERAFQI